MSRQGVSCLPYKQFCTGGKFRGCGRESVSPINGCSPLQGFAEPVMNEVNGEIQMILFYEVMKLLLAMLAEEGNILAYAIRTDKIVSEETVVVVGACPTCLGACPTCLGHTRLEGLEAAAQLWAMEHALAKRRIAGPHPKQLKIESRTVPGETGLPVYDVGGKRHITLPPPSDSLYGY
ncbi:hypothetical protein AAG570_000927 [Ranatra chinensis]|uniref:Uncharacterized protein n=1 Tax=Ranatra chinensis TaxID=642074 RepID=A0ABD0YYG9_9HEMI